MKKRRAGPIGIDDAHSQIAQQAQRRDVVGEQPVEGIHAIASAKESNRRQRS